MAEFTICHRNYLKDLLEAIFSCVDEEELQARLCKYVIDEHLSCHMDL